jgi:glycine C-acetyltransferase/8-amino-7-oxononanoate synthase
VLLDGKPVLLLCSNNYLGLADHPRVREAAAEAAMRYGAGRGASRLISGNMTIHRRLEEQLADFKGAEDRALPVRVPAILANAGVCPDAARSEGDVGLPPYALNQRLESVDGCRLLPSGTLRVRPLRAPDHPRVGLQPGRQGPRAADRDRTASSRWDGDLAPPQPSSAGQRLRRAR